MENFTSSRTVHQRSPSVASTRADSTNATSSEARRPRTAIAAAIGQVAVGTSHGLETGLKKTAAPVSWPDVIVKNTGPHILGYLIGTEVKALFHASMNDRRLMAQHPVGQLHSLKQNSNRGYLPTVDKLKANLKLLGETQPDKSMSRHALASLVALNELNNHPDSETIPSHRLGALALATLDHLNDGDIDHLNIKTELNPDQLQQVIDLLGTLPAAHPERTKIDRFVTYLTHKRECMLIIQNRPPYTWLIWGGPALHEQMRVDYDVALAAVQRDGRALQYVSAVLRADRVLVLAAVQRDGLALKYASKELRNNRRIVLAAVQRDGRALEYASEALRADLAVVLAAVQQWGGALEYAPQLQNNFEVVRAAVKRSGLNALQFACAALRAHPEIRAEAERHFEPKLK